jgi:hypothetical protein
MAAGGDGVVFTMGDELEAGDVLEGLGGETSWGSGWNDPPDVATDRGCDNSLLSPMLSRRGSSGSVFG